MALKFIDMTGKTEDEAVRKALAQLGLERDDVSVEILERAKSGFFGIGASPAKVRVSYGLEEEAAPAPAAPAKVEKVEKMEKVEKRAGESVKAAPKAEKHVEKRAEKREEKRTEKHAEKREEKRTEKRTEKRAEKREEPRKAKADASVSESVPAMSVDLGEQCTDEKAKEITAFLDGLLKHMNSAAAVKVYLDEEGRYKVILEGEKLGALIGRRGETLDAIQQLTNYSVNRGNDKRVRVHIDAENYRLKREQSLEHLAQKVAAKVLKLRRNVTLEPMNAYERHVIHTALQDVDGVTTYSMGTEPNRRVIVAVERK